MIDENIILKLSSGEEIVCRLVGDEHPRTFEITNPLMVSAVPKLTREGIEESISLRRWIHFADEEVFSVNKSSVIVKADASVGLSKFYEACVLRMLSEEEGSWNGWREPTEDELDEIEFEEALETYSNISKTIH
tara:strand:- start:179 stop:580 length:402 start_codon:yes stop_codon:yes gene_type:complete